MSIGLPFDGSRRKSALRGLASAALGILLASCGGGKSSPPPASNPPPPTFHATSGIAEKGPLINGSAVTAQELDASLSPTGKQYSYQISSDLGAFSPTSSFTSQYIGVTATGYYFDEVLGTVSAGPVTISGYSDLSIDTVMNVNILTTLAFQRIQRLVVTSGKTFAAARSQAEQEVLTALNIPVGSYGVFGTLKLSGNGDGAQILAAISSLFVQGNTAGEVNALINNFQNDIGLDGIVDNATTLLALQTAARDLDPAAVAHNLNQRFAPAGVAFAATDIAKWIDGNGDGVLGEHVFEVTNANASTTFTLPAATAAALNGKSIYLYGDGLIVNNVPVTGTVTIRAGDSIAVRAGTFAEGTYLASINSGSHSGVVRVTFIAPMDSLEVSPLNKTMIIGAQQSFTAIAHFSDGSTADLSNRVRWNSSSPNVASVEGIGLVKALALGAASIEAAIGTHSGTSGVNVVAFTLSDFTISPDVTNTGVGIAQKLRATGSYSDGSTRDVTHLVTWNSNDSSVASVDAQGVVNGIAVGSTTVEARIDTLTHVAAINVSASGVAFGQSMLAARRSHSATLLASGKLLVTGGESAPSANSAEIYDPVTATWSAAGTMANWHANHEATRLSDGRVLVTGGVGAGPAVPFADLYDPATNLWSEAGQMSLSRTDHTATLLLNGKVLVVGGNEGLGPIYTSTVLYDPATNTWSARANLGTPRAIHAATLLANGKVLVTGGRDVIGPAATSSVTATVELYDPESDTWSALAPMGHARLGHTATLLPNGKVLVVGGFDQANPVGSEIYDPETNTWSSAGAMQHPRLWHTSTLLANGVVLVAGGIIDAQGTETNSVEAYDPVTNSWSARAALKTERSFHTATRLNNNAVVVVGGGNETPPYIHNSTELYW